MNNAFIVESNKLKLLKQKYRNSNKSIRIILLSDAIGLYNDALIYKNVLPNSYIVNGFNIEDQDNKLYTDKS
tara:strand:- start:476 stop:691 length:216 start_codon:yes stop_codon:yes gene_type:complete